MSRPDEQSFQCLKMLRNMFGGLQIINIILSCMPHCARAACLPTVVANGVAKGVAKGVAESSRKLWRGIFNTDVHVMAYPSEIVLQNPLSEGAITKMMRHLS